MIFAPPLLPQSGATGKIPVAGRALPGPQDSSSISCVAAFWPMSLRIQVNGVFTCRSARYHVFVQTIVPDSAHDGCSTSGRVGHA
jgi:hypothetical protein